ncbi:MAG: hypothetical protein IKE58_02910 [Blautia sp.]|nr:hypothetical protein [Blautia sp.]
MKKNYNLLKLCMVLLLLSALLLEPISSSLSYVSAEEEYDLFDMSNELFSEEVDPGEAPSEDIGYTEYTDYAPESTDSGENTADGSYGQEETGYSQEEGSTEQAEGSSEQTEDSSGSSYEDEPEIEIRYYDPNAPEEETQDSSSSGQTQESPQAEAVPTESPFQEHKDEDGNIYYTGFYDPTEEQSAASDSGSSSDTSASSGTGTSVYDIIDDDWEPNGGTLPSSSQSILPTDSGSSGTSQGSAAILMDPSSSSLASANPVITEYVTVRFLDSQGRAITDSSLLPESVLVTLQRKRSSETVVSDIFSEAKSASVSNGWKVSFDNLAYEAGIAYAAHIYESDMPEGFTQSVSADEPVVLGTSSVTYNVTITLIQNEDASPLNIPVEIRWQDQNGYPLEDHLPDSVRIKLKRKADNPVSETDYEDAFDMDGYPVDPLTITSDTWNGAFTNLPYESFAFIEEGVKGYSKRVEQKGAALKDGVIIINTRKEDWLPQDQVSDETSPDALSETADSSADSETWQESSDIDALDSPSVDSASAEPDLPSDSQEETDGLSQNDSPSMVSTVDIGLEMLWVDVDGVSALSTGFPEEVVLNLLSQSTSEDGTSANTPVLGLDGEPIRAILTAQDSWRGAFDSVPIGNDNPVFVVRAEEIPGFTLIAIAQDAAGSGYVLTGKRELPEVSLAEDEAAQTNPSDAETENSEDENKEAETNPSQSADEDGTVEKTDSLSPVGDGSNSITVTLDMLTEELDPKAVTGTFYLSLYTAEVAEDGTVTPGSEPIQQVTIVFDDISENSVTFNNLSDGTYTLIETDAEGKTLEPEEWITTMDPADAISVAEGANEQYSFSHIYFTTEEEVPTETPVPTLTGSPTVSATPTVSITPVVSTAPSVSVTPIARTTPFTPAADSAEYGYSVTGLEGELEFRANLTYHFHVTGASAPSPYITGDGKWVPSYWSMSPGQTKDSEKSVSNNWSIMAKSDLNQNSSFNLYLYFQKYTWNQAANTWVETSEYTSTTYTFHTKSFDPAISATPSPTPMITVTPTPTTAPVDSASLNVTINLVWGETGNPLYVRKQTCYLGLFPVENPETEPASQTIDETGRADVYGPSKVGALDDPFPRVVALNFINGSQATATFTDIPAGSYYLAETDQYGEKISPEYYVSDLDENKRYDLKIGDFQTEIITHTYESLPEEEQDDYYFTGNLKITKQLIGDDGNAFPADETFYASIYSDEAHTRLASEEEQVNKARVALIMDGESEASETIEVKIPVNQPQVQLYVAETDATGTILTDKTDSFRFKPSVINDAPVILNADQQAVPEEGTADIEETIIQNFGPSSTPTPTPSPTPTPTTTATPTATPRPVTSTPTPKASAVHYNPVSYQTTTGSTGSTVTTNVTTAAQVQTTTNTTSNIQAVNTADETPIAFYFLLLLSACIGIGLVMQKKAKR